MVRRFPARPSFSSLRKQAKQFLKRQREGDREVRSIEPWTATWRNLPPCCGNEGRSGPDRPNGVNSIGGVHQFDSRSTS